MIIFRAFCLPTSCLLSKKQLLKGKLANISKGKVNVDYRMRFPEAKKNKIIKN
ncbi:hypothetical protein CCAN2_1210009 [Capnocytophaga canimorsus]|nr:hypothetical protein CCAN2_1210009 [Capnocytophaga canimorsus]